MLRQREPLRVPREWTGEKRGFVMAVERALDGLYKLFGRLTFSDFDKSFQERVESTESRVTTLENDKLDKIACKGVSYAKARSNIAYCKILTIKVKSTYVNCPLLIEISRRGAWYTHLQITFANANDLDPGLLGFYADDGGNTYYLHKSATSTWDLYGAYYGSYGEMSIHRITGRGADPSFFEITANVENEVNSLPTGYVRATLWRTRWMRETQKSVLTELDDNGNAINDGITSIPTAPGVYRVTAVIAGLPAGSNGYGPLLVINGGSYLGYYYIDARNDLYYARTASVTAPSKWYKVTDTEVGLTT